MADQTFEKVNEMTNLPIAVESKLSYVYHLISRHTYDHGAHYTLRYMGVDLAILRKDKKGFTLTSLAWTTVVQIPSFKTMRDACIHVAGALFDGNHLDSSVQWTIAHEMAKLANPQSVYVREQINFMLKLDAIHDAAKSILFTALIAMLPPENRPILAIHDSLILEPDPEAETAALSLQLAFALACTAVLEAGDGSLEA